MEAIISEDQIIRESVLKEINTQIDLVKELVEQQLNSDTEGNNITLDKPHNRIVFGAPGTGKSFRLKEDIKQNKLEGVCERITLHPNYTYTQFVGTYKPISKIVKEGEQEKNIVAYEFVPGPFLRVLIDALRDEDKNIPHVLVIEEINRANPAGVFGDVFQLLDRDSTGKSTYTINISEEMKKYISEKLNRPINELYIPSNMYIWATMNSADQGVYPMDSAFKRRWAFEYIGVNENEHQLHGKPFEFIYLKNEQGGYTKYKWNTVRKAINAQLKSYVNEDKLLGPFFLSETELQQDNKMFDETFKSKVLMYLFEDILKHKKVDFFVSDVMLLSDVMDAYDKGCIFNFEIQSEEIDYSSETSQIQQYSGVAEEQN